MTDFIPLTHDDTLSEVRSAFDLPDPRTILETIGHLGVNEQGWDSLDDIRTRFWDDFVGTANLPGLVALPDSLSSLRAGWVSTAVDRYLAEHCHWPEDVAATYINLAGWDAEYDAINAASDLNYADWPTIARLQRVVITYIVRRFANALFTSLVRNDYYESLTADIDHHLNGVAR